MNTAFRNKANAIVFTVVYSGGNKMHRIRAIRSLLFALIMLAVSAASFAQIGISVRIGPPALPVYEQPVCPGDGYIWTPGYWAYGQDGYFWVPGTWVLAPQPGYLWTPPWWGWNAGFFGFHEGYWGLHIGFYGGINYGFGYFGHGYEGGRWDGDHFYYNRSVTNVNVTNVRNVYNTTVINNNTNRVSFNGGEGGVHGVATPQEEAAERERHVGPVAAQNQHVEMARSNPQLRSSVNQGRPPIAATARPGEFDRGAVPAREASAPNEGARGENNVPRPGNAGGNEARDLQPHEVPKPPSTGNDKVDQKYQQQQQKLVAKQNAEHAKLAQKQDADHQRAAQKNYNDAQKQQVEQRHQQQTQQLEQKHTQQQQHLASHQQSGHH
jgi:hypothetical protein